MVLSVTCIIFTAEPGPTLLHTHSHINRWNIAEAVNFATIDWLKWGRQSELVYMSARRQSVISVDHLSMFYLDSLPFCFIDDVVTGMCAIAELLSVGAGEVKEQSGLKRDLSFM